MDTLGADGTQFLQRAVQLLELADVKNVCHLFSGHPSDCTSPQVYHGTVDVLHSQALEHSHSQWIIANLGLGSVVGDHETDLVSLIHIQQEVVEQFVRRENVQSPIDKQWAFIQLGFDFIGDELKSSSGFSSQPSGDTT